MSHVDKELSPPGQSLSGECGGWGSHSGAALLKVWPRNFDPYVDVEFTFWVVLSDLYHDIRVIHVCYVTAVIL